MTEENKRKKEYLCKYAEAKKAVKRYDLQLEELRANQIMPCGGMSDMPKAHNKTDLSDYAARLDELEKMYWKARYDQIDLYIRIGKAIEEISNEDEKTELVLRYIKGLTWEEIAVEMCYSWKTVHRLHARALQSVKIPIMT